MVLVRGTVSNPVWVDRRCLLPALAEIARQSSAKYVGANPCRHHESPCIMKMLHYSAVVFDSFHVYVYYFMFSTVLQSGCRYVCVWYCRVDTYTVKQHRSWSLVSVIRRLKPDSHIRSTDAQTQWWKASLSVFRRKSQCVPHRCGHSLPMATSAARCVRLRINMAGVNNTGVLQTVSQSQV